MNWQQFCTLYTVKLSVHYNKLNHFMLELFKRRQCKKTIAAYTYSVYYNTHSTAYESLHKNLFFLNRLKLIVDRFENDRVCVEYPRYLKMQMNLSNVNAVNLLN